MAEPWEDLIGTTGEERPMRLLRRKGKAFLLLPPDRNLALKGLELYAPQTNAARLAKRLLRAALLFGLYPGLEKVTIRPVLGTEFANYLALTVGLDRQQFPDLALLAGNPQPRGRRCVFILFQKEGTVGAVVKAGAGQDAMRLIEQEERFLKAAPKGLRGVPQIRSGFFSEEVRALAMNYIEGTQPGYDDHPAVARLLSSWISPTGPSPVNELPAWRRLTEQMGSTLPAAAQEPAETKVVPVIAHGDFAPWNIKVNAGEWTLLDWERGEMNGMPLWDWLHYLVQPAVLVDKVPEVKLLERIDRLFRSELFKGYARKTGISGVERPLTLAYFYYCIYVIAQTEGTERLKKLVQAALDCWSLKA